MKKTKLSPKKQLAKQAVSSAIQLANANAGKLKSVKIKLKFDGGKKSSKKQRGRSKTRGGY